MAITYVAPETVIIVRPNTSNKKSTAIIGWPGLLGALSGINQDGTSIGISVVPSFNQVGIPNQFLFRSILENHLQLKMLIV